MKKIIKNCAALLCALSVCLSLVPVVARAAVTSEEITGTRTPYTVFSDDFEQYTAGDDAFYNVMSKHGYTARTKSAPAALNIISDGDNQYLDFTAGSQQAAFATVTQSISGDFTLQFDFRTDNTSGQIFYITMWNNSKLAEYTEIRSNSIRFQHRQYYTGETAVTPDVDISNTYAFDKDTWYSAKLVRTTGGVYVKVWEKGTSEPDEWTCSNEHSIYDSSLSSQVRFNLYSAATTACHFYMDNLKISKRADVVETGFPTAPQSGVASAKKVLIIGDEGAEDLAAYLPQLGQLCDVEYSVGCLTLPNTTLRNLAGNTTSFAAVYDYYKGNDATDYIMEHVGEADEKVTLTYALSEEDWDAIIFKQGTVVDGIFGTYDEDFNFLLDLFADRAPNAAIYWNMNWAPDDNYPTSTSYKAYYGTLSTQYTSLDYYESYYYNETALHYNAIIDNVNEFILPNENIDGVIYTGAAMENVRNSSLGSTVTRDGYALSYQEGRLTAGLTVLKALDPSADLNDVTASGLAGILSGTDTYSNTDANLAVLRSAVRDASSGTMTKRAVPDVQPAISEEGVITVDCGAAPHYIRFPDIASMDDGTLYVTACDATNHGPTVADDERYAIEGEMRTYFYKSTDNGLSWQKTGFVLTAQTLSDWGLYPKSDRYTKWRSDPNCEYLLFAHPCDANIVSAHVDVDGDSEKENILVLTFWSWNLTSNPANAKSSGATYLTYSLDGLNWADPVKMSGGLKRGDLTEFADGSLLIPLYSKTQVVCMAFTDGKFTEQYRTTLPNTAPDDGVEFNETSLYAPNGGDTVYAFIRSSGLVLRSDDKGKNWYEVGNEIGTAVQPGFADLGDGRAFVTWARDFGPRSIYGKVFDTNADWSDTDAQLLYASGSDASHDMGDPSCAVTADGNVVVVMYDTYYRAVVAKIFDPDSDMFLPIDQKSENTEDYQSVNVSEDFETAAGHYSHAGFAANNALRVIGNGSTNALSFVEDVPLTFQKIVHGTHTVTADFVLPDDDASFTLNTTIGTVSVSDKRLTVNGSQKTQNLVAGTLTHLKVRVYGGTKTTGNAKLQVKIWQGTTEPGTWTKVSTGTTANAKTQFAGTAGTLLESFSIAQTVRLGGMAEGQNDFVDMEDSYVSGAHTAFTITPNIQPVQTLYWSSDAPQVATVDADGTVTCMRAGTAHLTCRTALGASKTTTLTVQDNTSAEALEVGETTALVSENFDASTALPATMNIRTPTNSQMQVTTDSNIAIAAAGTRTSDDKITLASNCVYLPTGDGKNGIFTASDIEGDATLQFDFYHTGSSSSGIGTFYCYVYDHFKMLHTIQICNDGIRIHINSSANPYSRTIPVAQNAYNAWYTVKIARCASCICFKVWERGTEEPFYWQDIYVPEAGSESAKFADAVQTGNGTAFGVRNASSYDLYIDNFTVSHQTDALAVPTVSYETNGSTVTLGVSGATDAAYALAAFYNAAGEMVKTATAALSGGVGNFTVNNAKDYRCTVFFMDSAWLPVCDAIVKK